MVTNEFIFVKMLLHTLEKVIDDPIFQQLFSWQFQLNYEKEMYLIAFSGNLLPLQQISQEQRNVFHERRRI
jgi:hypothetical protein